MNILRWILFIPLAFLACIVAGALSNYISRFIGIEFISYIISGLFSAVAFIYVATLIAPKTNNFVKWSCIVITGLLGFLSALGSFLSGDKLASLSGLIMLIIALLFISKKPEELID